MNHYTIRELSQRYNIPVSTLRYYEDLGLLENVIHTEKNRRLYTDEHITRLNAIQCFKKTGLSLENMQEFFRYEKNISENIDNILTMVSEHEANVLERIQVLQKELYHIRHKVLYYSRIKKAIEENGPWPEWEDCAP